MSERLWPKVVPIVSRQLHVSPAGVSCVVAVHVPSLWCIFFPCGDCCWEVAVASSCRGRFHFRRSRVDQQHSLRCCSEWVPVSDASRTVALLPCVRTRRWTLTSRWSIRWDRGWSLGCSKKLDEEMHITFVTPQVQLGRVPGKSAPVCENEVNEGGGNGAAVSDEAKLISRLHL